MKKFSETSQQQSADNGGSTVPADGEEQPSKRLKVTDELRYIHVLLKSTGYTPCSDSLSIIL